MKRHLQCAKQQVSRSNLTKYCVCHAERLAYLVLITYETSFTERGTTGVTIQPHQILRLSRRKTRILSPHHIWNVIYSARSNWCHHQTSPNIAPVTQKDSHSESSSHMKPHFQCAEQQVSLSNLTKYCAYHEKWHCKISKKISKNRWNVISNAGTIREWSDHDPSMIRAWKRKPQPASSPRLLFELTTSFAPNLTFKPSPNTAPTTKSNTSTSRSTAPATKSDTWTSPSTAPATKSDTGTSPSTAPATKSDTWTSPNTAPVTQKDSHSESSSHMKPHFQCAEQQASPSNITKYCACHAKLHCEISDKIFENRWNVISNAGTIREWSENDPSMIRAWSENENANRNPPRKWGYFSRSPEAFSIVKYNVSRPILHSNLHQVLHLPRKVTLELHEVLRLPRKVTLELHQVLHLPQKVTLELHQVLRLPRKVTLELHQIKRLTFWVLITYETSFPMRGATGLPLQHHQILRLSRKIALRNFWQNLWKQVKRHFQCGDDPRMIREWSEHDPSMIREWKRKPQPASQVRLLFEVPRSIFYCKIQRFAPNLTFKPSPSAAPATKSDTWTEPNTAPTTKNNTWTSPSTAPATKSDTWTSPNTAPTTKNNTWTSPSTAPATKSDTWTSPNIAPTTKNNTWTSPSIAPATKSDTSTSPNTAPTTKSNTWTSPSTAPATKSDTWTSPNTAPTTLLDTTLLDSTLYLTLLYLTLLYLTWLYSTWLLLTLLYLTTLYLTLLYLTLLYLTWLLTLLYLTWLLTLLYLTLLDSTTLLDTTLLDSTWLYSLLDTTLLDTTLLDLTLLYLTLLDSTLLDLTLLYLTLLDSTLLDLTLLYLTLLDSTLLDLSLLYLTLLGCRSYIGSFSAKLPLIIYIMIKYYFTISMVKPIPPVLSQSNTCILDLLHINVHRRGPG